MIRAFVFSITLLLTSPSVSAEGYVAHFFTGYGGYTGMSHFENVSDFEEWTEHARYEVQKTTCSIQPIEDPCAVKNHWLKQLSAIEVEKYLSAGTDSQDRLVGHVMLYLIGEMNRH